MLDRIVKYSYIGVKTFSGIPRSHYKNPQTLIQKIGKIKALSRKKNCVKVLWNDRRSLDEINIKFLVLISDRTDAGTIARNAG